MSKRIDQVELGKTIAQLTGQPDNIVDAYVEQLFKEIEKRLVTNSSLTVEGLGFFRIIKSGDSNKVLFMGDRITPKTFVKTTTSNRTSENKKVYNEISEAKPFQSANSEVNSISDETVAERIEYDKPSDTINEREETTEKPVANNNAQPQSKPNKTKGQSYAEYSARHAKENRKSNLIKTTVIGTIIIVICLILYFFLFSSAKAQNKNDALATTGFLELNNPDSLLYNCVIMPKSDVTLQFLAEKFYGEEDFWPYIYHENKSNVNNVYIIKAGSTIKIPRIIVDITDVYNGNLKVKTEKMAEQIYNSAS